MYIHQIEARDLPDLWFLAVHDILDNGNRFVIDRGSYAGQTRLEYDYFMGHVKHPGTQPLIPDIPPACGIPNPVEHDYIYGGSGYDRAYIEYLMSARKEPGESYTYGERLTKVPLTGDKLVWWEAGNTEIVDKSEAGRCHRADAVVNSEREGTRSIHQSRVGSERFRESGRWGDNQCCGRRRADSGGRTELAGCIHEGSGAGSRHIDHHRAGRTSCDRPVSEAHSGRTAVSRQRDAAAR